MRPGAIPSPLLLCALVIGVTFSLRDVGLFVVVIRRRLGVEPLETGIVTFSQTSLLPRLPDRECVLSVFA
jgi:hypothetical protein